MRRTPCVGDDDGDDDDGDDGYHCCCYYRYYRYYCYADGYRYHYRYCRKYDHYKNDDTNRRVATETTDNVKTKKQHGATEYT